MQAILPLSLLLLLGAYFCYAEETNKALNEDLVPLDRDLLEETDLALLDRQDDAAVKGFQSFSKKLASVSSAINAGTEALQKFTFTLSALKKFAVIMRGAIYLSLTFNAHAVLYYCVDGSSKN